jgi:hypothetical protein
MEPGNGGARGRAAKQVGKLLRVVVMGGAVLASNCTSTSPKRGSSGDSAAQGGARDGGSAPDKGGGVQGW